MINIRDADDTLDYIIHNRVSTSRYGDGEITVMDGGRMGFQEPNPLLAARLRDVLQSDMDGHAICLPYGWKNKKGLRKSNRRFWRWFVADNYELLITTIRKDKVYLSANYTRVYMDSTSQLKHSEFMNDYWNRFRLQWQDRDVLMVEGESTRFGVGNGILANAYSVRRILCPSKNAFDVYDKILSNVSENSNNDTLILCALGMTATVLTYDLAREGKQALDIGHADIEYEWYLKGVVEKVPVEGKNVNELGMLNPDAPYDSKYESEIIARVL